MCPDENELVAMLERALDPARAQQLEAHFDGCATCGAMIAALAGTRPAALGTPRAWAEAALGLDDLPALPDGVIAGRYEVRDRIGHGGMGAVFLARDVTLDRDVALKLHRRGSGDERLQREALAMARLAHPNVVTVFEIDSVDDRLFVAMEYVRGTTLRAWLATPRPWRARLGLLLEAGAGLAAAHAAGLIHRDFKPENVLVGDDGRPRVGDFGLARADDGVGRAPEAELAPPASDLASTGTGSPDARGPRPEASTAALGTPPPAAAGTPATVTGLVVGTPAYMAPEQFAGGPIDARCDQFAFCVVAWEALYGARPFAGATATAIQLAIEQGAITRPTERAIPARVREVLERGLRVAPEDRHPDLATLLAALRRAAAPRAARRLAIGGVAALGIVAAAIPVRGAIVSHRREAACEAEADAVRARWDAGRRAEVQRALIATGSPFATEAFERTARALDRDAEVLATAIAATCADDTSPATLVAARRACLDERAAELSGLIDALAHADAAVVMRAPGAAWGVFDPTPCDDVHPTTAGPPSAPAHVAAFGRAKGLADTGRYDEAVAALTPLLALARAAHDRGLELEVLLALGDAHADREDAAQAVPVLHRAQALAESLGRDLEASAALGTLANLAGVVQQDYPAAHRYLDLARAKLDRLGDGNPVARARLLATEAQVLMDEYRAGDAEPRITQAVALLEQAYGPDHPQVGAALGIASQVARALGKHEASLAASRRTLDILRRALGDGHPTVAGAELNLGSALLGIGKFAEARDRLLAADRVFARVFGDAHPVRAAVAGNLGDAELGLGHPDAAIAALARAVAILEATQGPESPAVTGARRDLARMLAAGDRIDDAIAEVDRAIAILEPMGDDGLGRLRAALVERAQYRLAAARPDVTAARGDAERAIAISDAHPELVNPGELADARFTLARALGSGAARARTLARQALETATTEQRGEIEGWLAGK